jgi:glycosyltransferase involved in cell wall biosynthesis
MGLIEALSYGLPCIATDGTNIAGEISSYSAGWTATADAESIKNAFLKMLADRDKLSACGKKAIVNARIDGEGRVVTEGGQILIGGNDSYVAMCHSCWMNAIERGKK